MRNLNEHTITDEVLRRMEETANPRIHQLMISLVQHLHDFARETSLTEEEWFAGMAFLARTGSFCSRTRHEFILLSDTLGLSQLVVAQNHSRPKEATEQTVFGPFHVEGAPERPAHGTDLALEMEGDPLYVTARFSSRSGPVAGALVDVWHADSEGKYDVQNKDWRIDDAKLRAVFRTDQEGRIGFRTIVPKSYPIPMDGTVGEMLRATNRHAMRPAHIHFRVQKAGFDPLVTHIFVDGDEFLDSDAVFGVRESCIGKYIRQPPGKTPFGDIATKAYYTLDYTFSLHSLASAVVVPSHVES
jgi:hydroxyquinol 1,2-dioxygenase